MNLTFCPHGTCVDARTPVVLLAACDVRRGVEAPAGRSDQGRSRIGDLARVHILRPGVTRAHRGERRGRLLLSSTVFEDPSLRLLHQRTRRYPHDNDRGHQLGSPTCLGVKPSLMISRLASRRVHNSLLTKSQTLSFSHTARTMRPLTPDQLNPAILKVQYAVRGELAIKAEELREKLLDDKHGLPFNKVISSNIGNPQQKGLDQPALTFPRQVRRLPLLVLAGGNTKEALCRSRRSWSTRPWRSSCRGSGRRTCWTGRRNCRNISAP